MGTFRRLRNKAICRKQDDRGASLVEYALLLALIAVVCIGAVTFLGKSASSKYQTFGNCWQWAGTASAAPAGC